jgi:hypothetical protein
VNNKTTPSITLSRTETPIWCTPKNIGKTIKEKKSDKKSKKTQENVF